MGALLLFDKTPRTLVRWLSLGLLLAVQGGCVQTHSYRELDLPDKSFGEIWVGLQEVTRRLGYAASRAETDRGKGVFQSTWHTRFKHPRGTTRRRLRAEVERIGPEQAGWRVRCYVEKQKVGSIGRSVSPREEDWEPDGQDVYLENTFVATLRAELGLGAVAPTNRPTDEQPTRIR